MSDDAPDQNTQWVACAMVNAALKDLAVNLAAYLASDVPQADGLPRPENTQLVRHLLDLAIHNVALSVDFTDLTRDQFDADRAKSLALEMMAEIDASIRSAAFHE